MRISALEGDPGYLPEGDYRRTGAKIYLDGVEQQHVVTADEQEGVIAVVRQDGEGTIVADSYGDVLLDKRRGKVRIDVPTGLSAVSAIASEARFTIGWKTDHHISAGRVDNHYSFLDCMAGLDALLNSTRRALEAIP